MFQILDNEQKIKYKDMLDRFPYIRLKFKENKFYCGDSTYSYDDFTKVKIDRNKTKFLATPTAFCDTPIKETDLVVDYAPVYIIGMLELINYSMLGEPRLVEYIWNTLTEELTLYSSYADVEQHRLKFSDTDYSKEYMYNLLLLMRTDYNVKQYEILMSFIPQLMLCYELNKRKFFEILFECLTYSTRYIPEIIKDLYTNEYMDNISVSDRSKLMEEILIRQKLTVSWLNKYDDLHLQRIKYRTQSKKWHSITDCRGFCILQTLKLLYFCVVNHAEKNEKSIIKYNDKELVKLFDKPIQNTLGDDYQSKILQGEEVPLSVTDRGNFAPAEKKVYSFILSDGKHKVTIPRNFYEDEILFKKAFDVKTPKMADMEIEVHAKSYSVNYIRFGDMLGAVIKTLRTAENLQSEIEIKRITELEQTNRTLKTNYETLKQKYDKEHEELIEKKEYADQNSKITELEAKVKELETLIQSKNEIIETQTNKLSELNGKFSNMFNEDDITDETDEEDDNIPLEEKINALNGFSFCFLGGFQNVLQKCEEKGWTNITQVQDVSVFNSTCANYDFFAVFTKFVGHRLTRSVEANYSNLNKRVCYFNSLNVDMLITQCYKLVQKFFFE